MKPFEEHIKDALEGFEPEPSSSVWNGVQNSLHTPSSGTSAFKSLLSSSGSAAGWIAAAAALVAGGVLVYTLYKSPASSHKNEEMTQPALSHQTEKTAESVKVENNSTINQSTNKVNPVFLPSKQDETNSADKHVQSQAAEIIDPHSSLAVLPGLNNATVQSAVNNNNTHNMATDEHENIRTTNVSALPNNYAMSPASGQENPAALVEPVLILSAHAGFAPLNVTAFINQDKVKADYNFGDGETVYQSENASHRFKTEGIYTVSALYNGRKLESKVTVYGEIPTAFSPNGDGVNDLFIITSDINTEQIEIRIYDRSGKTLYQHKGNGISWDGSNAETGTYFYDIFGNTSDGSAIKQKGIITLFR